MSFWVKVKAKGLDRFYHINLEHVTHMFPDGGATMICFLGREQPFITVDESPETILTLPEQPPTTRI